MFLLKSVSIEPLRHQARTFVVVVVVVVIVAVVVVVVIWPRCNLVIYACRGACILVTIIIY